MKKLLFLAFSLVVFMTVGCGGPSQKTESDEADSARVDTVATEDVVTEEVPANDAALGDLCIFDLSGKVEKCVWKSSNGTATYVFDESGKWLGKDGQRLEDLYPGGIKRDAAGRIMTAEADGYGSVHYAYNADGKVTSIDEDGLKRKLIYDTEGNVAKEIQELAPEMGDDEGEPEVTTLQFTILERDAVGNWIKRKSSQGTETRMITYFNK